MASKCSLTAKLYNFSDEMHHIPGTESIVELSDDNNDFLRKFSLCVYSNGDNLENQGYVSLSLNFCPLVNIPIPQDDESTYYVPSIYFHSLSYFSIPQDVVSSCCVSVIDVDKKERFTRSFSGECNMHSISFDMSKYIARNTLVEEASELLPDNCLTIRISIIYHEVSDMKYFGELDKLHRVLVSSIKIERESNFIKLILNLDSEVGRRLYEESTFFKDMIDYTSRRDMEIQISSHDFTPFIKLCMIIMGSVALQFSSLVQLCRVYELADKYDVPSAVETCRTLIKLYLNWLMKDKAFDEFSSTEGHLILRVADKTRDDFLKEITNNFMQRNYAYFEGKGEIEWECVGFKLTRPIGLHDSCITFRRDHQERLSFYS